MPTNAEIIDEVIGQHRLIRHNIKLVGDSLVDVEALFNLQKAQAAWAQSSVEELSEKKERVGQVLSVLTAGLKNHFDYEERVLPPLFGEVLMKALIIEHRGIQRRLERSALAVNGLNLQGVAQTEALAAKTRLQQVIADLTFEVEEHAGHEELILRMMKKVFEPGRSP